MSEKKSIRQNWEYMHREYTDSLSENLNFPHHEGLGPNDQEYPQDQVMNREDTLIGRMLSAAVGLIALGFLGSCLLWAFTFF